MSWAASHGGVGVAEGEILALGRKIYTTTCTACHVAPPVDRFSVTEWPRLVRKMAPRENLKEFERTAVEAYLVAARRTLP